ncbi:MAG: SusC/RagA family TonB-linked outer membrane protein [Verrucomicrobia bacterium]|nr:SusC/RagA family TonB-linked outer membrane protein [Cytophagales bacterium]
MLCLFLSFCLLTGNIAMAQEKSVSGKVVAADGTGIPGVNVILKGTTKGANTDADGNFKINAPEGNGTLVFSFIGFISQEVAIGNQSEINVTLAEDTKQLNEVVVTALGIKKDARVIGYATQEVKGQELVKAREPNPINSLAGKVAGLTVGASPELLRRPNVSLRGNSDVLYVVDGVAINSDTWNISPDDIESYTVLKGPNASALYGFRGKNGAILITTKKGSKDKRGFSVEVNSSTMFDKGFNAIPKVQDTYGPGDHGVYEFVDGKGAGKNDGDYDVWGPRFSYVDNLGNPVNYNLPQYDSPIDPTTGVRSSTPWVARGKDNLGRFLQTGLLSTNSVSVSSSTEKADLRFGVTHSYQKGIVPNTKLNITNLNASVGLNFSPKLRFDLSVNYNRQYTPNIPDVNYGPNSMIYNIIIWAGADWDIDAMKNYWQPGKEGVQQIYAEYQRYNNPYFLTYEWLRGHYKTDVYGYTALTYKFTPFLEATFRTQITTWDLFRSEKFPTSAGSYGRDERKGDYREDRRSLFENNTDLLVKFDKNIGSDFSIKAWVGAALRTFKYNQNYATTNYINVPASSLNPSGYSFGNSRDPIIASSYNAGMQVGSAYYSADFSYKNFLNLSTTGRVDKLSTLPNGNNAFFYPSVSLSAVISDIINIPNPISFLKLRASYANVKDGLTQSTIGAYNFPLGYGESYRSSYDGPTYENSAVYATPLVYNNQPAAYYTNTLNNPNIKPNSSSQFETGLDIRFLKNRLGLDVTYFISNDGPRIFSLPISETSGYSAALVNGIKTRKDGLEIALNGTPIKAANGFTWDVLVNWSTFKETLTEIYPGVNTLNNFLKVGDRLDKFYAGAYVKTREGQFINDAGGRPIRNPRPQFLGYLNPDYVWGINNKFNYKGISFSFQFDGRVGGVISNYIQRQTFRGGRHIATTEGDMGVARFNDQLGARTIVGPGVVVSNGKSIQFDQDGNITNYDELQFTGNTTATYLQDYISRYYQDDQNNLMSRTFAKLREVTLGYSLPQSNLENTFIRQATISFVGRNLLYFAERKDIDLDQYLSGGGSNIETPTTRRFGFNIGLTF